ncbi:hypothetical protein BZA77DRAFT_122184 [Pyronema omphalodes]|nr:hypothetical protein BZA77DRAFT_122184 [Pyronema omphalodes]
MFNAATPPAARRPRGAAGGAKPKATTPSNQDLPYISPMASSAYGSKATNVPKPPRLSDTRVRLAEGMQAKENEMNARLKAELEKREQEEAAARAIAERNQPPTVVASMPPPSPARTTRASSRETRERTVEDTTIDVQPELSTLSTVDNSATFASPFVIDQAVGSKVVERTPDFNNDMDEPDMSYMHESLPTPAPEAHYPSIDKASKARSAGYQNLTPAQSFDTAPSPRRSTRNRVVKPDPQVLPAPPNPSISGSVTSKTPRKPTRGKSNPPHLHPGDKENSVSNSLDTPKTRGRRVKKDQERRPKRPTALVDAYEVDTAPPNVFDRFFRRFFAFRDGLRMSGWNPFVVFIFLVVPILSAMIFLNSWSALGRHSLGGPYSPPNAPVTNIQHLVDRLFELEQNLGSVDSRLSNKFQEGITDLKSALSKASADSSSAASMSEKTSKETASLLRSLQAQLDDLQRSTLSYRRTMSEELRKAQEAAKAAGKQPTDILGPRQIREEVTNAVKAALPTSLAATVKPDGSVEISDTFKTALQDLFNTFFPRHFSQELKKANLDSIRAVPSWQTFMAENEERLRTTIDDRVDSAIKKQKSAEPALPADAVLTSDTVMAMVVDKLEEYQRNWEKTTLYPILKKHFTSFESSLEKNQNAHLENLQSSINRAQETLVQSAVAAASSVASQVARKVSSTTATTKGTGAQAAGIQIPDYANKITGAAVWPYLTSPSWEFGSKRNSLSSLWGKLLPGLESRHAPSPVIALLPTTDVGDCWPFPGGYGTLAVRLSEEIYPTHFTIEHAPKLLAPDFSSAPKVIEFWVQIKNATERALVESRAAALAEKSGKPYAMERIMAPGPPESNDAVYRVDKNSREFVKVDTVIYEGGAEDGVESFELSTDFQQMGVKIGIVAVVVRENWGNEDFTCLYRVRVHGFTPGEEKKEEKKGWW